jgi:signal transduction histidine kinase
MLRAVNWTVRVGVIALAGAYIFAFLPGYPAVKIAAFGVAVVSTAIWLLTDHSAANRQRYAYVLPFALGAMTVISALASVTPNGGPILILSFVGALAAARTLSPAVAFSIAGLALIGVVCAEAAATTWSWSAVGSAAATIFGAVLIGQNTRAYQLKAEQAAELLEQTEQLRQEQATVAALDERARIAREVHDVLAHSLGALGLQIQVVRAVLTDSGDVEKAVELLDQARRMASDGLRETRRAVHALRGDTPALTDGLAELSASHQRRHGAPVRFEVSGEPRALSADAGLAITRAAQEALVNTAKHAPHQPVDIRLDYTGGSTRLVVTNPLGQTGEAEHEPALDTVNGGYGLAGMRERLLLLHGALSAGRQGSDWVVEATVPQ